MTSECKQSSLCNEKINRLGYFPRCGWDVPFHTAPAGFFITVLLFAVVYRSRAYLGASALLSAASSSGLLWMNPPTQENAYIHAYLQVIRVTRRTLSQSVSQENILRSIARVSKSTYAGWQWVGGVWLIYNADVKILPKANDSVGDW